ncbi:MAG: hypothetical protein MZW92_75300 [Comamonadaceae bacterium]|nr:hypothetical protein [Comamonadaceae bacterium]
MMAFIGVRISWLMFARKSALRPARRLGGILGTPGQFELHRLDLAIACTALAVDDGCQRRRGAIRIGGAVRTQQHRKQGFVGPAQLARNAVMLLSRRVTVGQQIALQDPALRVDELEQPLADHRLTRVAQHRQRGRVHGRDASVDIEGEVATRCAVVQVCEGLGAVGRRGIGRFQLGGAPCNQRFQFLLLARVHLSRRNLGANVDAHGDESRLTTDLRANH